MMQYAWDYIIVNYLKYISRKENISKLINSPARVVLLLLMQSGIVCQGQGVYNTQSIDADTQSILCRRVDSVIEFV